MESWVLFPSLLSDLGDQPRALLEEASEGWQRGNYVEASQIFHSYSKDCAMAPVVALEYADMLQAQWLDKKRAEFLDTVIDQGGVELPDATRKLLELMRAHAKLRAGGTLEESISTARIAREWLREAADGDLSELQVSLAPKASLSITSPYQVRFTASNYTTTLSITALLSPTSSTLSK